MPSPDAPPAIFDPVADRAIPDRAVAFWRGRGDEHGGEPELRRALTPDERSRLECRAAALRAALVPASANDRRLRAAIGAMLGGYVQMLRHDAATARVIEGAFLYVVRAEPAWAIVEACELVRGGRAGLKPGFPPTEAEFARLVAQPVAILRQRLRVAEALLNAQPPAIPARRLTRAEIEAKLGRALGAPMGAADGG